MRWRYKPPRDLCEPHLWFAWFPVRIGRQTIWLERVTRVGYSTWGGIVWEYSL
jgi:hypothetical protein